jgi:hypothetical protein
MVTLRAEIDAAEHEWDRVDSIGDTAAVARTGYVLGPRLDSLRRAIAAAETTRTTVEGSLLDEVR